MTQPEKEIQDIKAHLNDISDNVDKIIYLERWKTDREQANLMSSGVIDVMSGIDQVLQWVIIEIKHLKGLPEQKSKPDDDTWYASYFNITYLDWDDMWSSDEYHIDNINLEKKYDVPDPKMIIKPHTKQEFEDYDKLMGEMKKIVREEISNRLQTNISGTLKFLEHHLEKYQGDSIYVLHDPDEVKNPDFRDSFIKHHSDAKLIIGYPEHKENPDFMEFYKENRTKKVNKKPFLLFIQEMLPNFPEISEARKNTIREWVEEKLNDIKNNVTPTPVKEKIKWLGSPAVLAFLMQEFVAHHYIQPPNYGSEATMTGLAKLCYEYFDIKAKPEYFERAMRNPDALANAKKQKFTIPDSSDIA